MNTAQGTPGDAVSLPDRARAYASVRPRFVPDASRGVRMSAVIGALWDALGSTGYSWVGFYLPEQAEPALSSAGGSPSGMVLAARAPKPACSPIGLNGMCGRSFLERRTIIVRDVRTLPADGYIACDPNDLSEIVVPMLDERGRCLGVLDADSHHAGAFGPSDAAALLRVLRESGLYSFERDPELAEFD